MELPYKSAFQFQVYIQDKRKHASVDTKTCTGILQAVLFLSQNVEMGRELGVR
jgi:hypothetical protein